MSKKLLLQNDTDDSLPQYVYHCKAMLFSLTDFAVFVLFCHSQEPPPHYELTYDLKGAGTSLDRVPGLTNMIHVRP